MFGTVVFCTWDFFFLRYCLVRSLHYASGNFDTNTVKESTQVWSAAQLSQGHFSFSLLMLSASHLRFPNNYGELRRQFKSLFRLGVWFQGNVLPQGPVFNPQHGGGGGGRREEKESLTVCVLRGKRSKDQKICLQHRSSVNLFRRKCFMNLCVTQIWVDEW